VINLSSQRVSFISLGCPKALVDSEQIVTNLVDAGYDVVAEHEEAGVVIVNTCGFIDSAKAESFAAIEQALALGREVVVTGAWAPSAMNCWHGFQRCDTFPDRRMWHRSCRPCRAMRQAPVVAQLRSGACARESD